MWPKHGLLSVVEGIEAPSLPVTEPFCQCSEEEDFEIPVFLTAVFKSSCSIRIVWTAIHVDLIIVLSKRQVCISWLTGYYGVLVNARC